MVEVISLFNGICLEPGQAYLLAGLVMIDGGRPFLVLRRRFSMDAAAAACAYPTTACVVTMNGEVARWLDEELKN